MTDPIQLDTGKVLEATRARAAQTYAQLLDEVARLTVYASELESRLAEKKEPDAWGDPSQENQPPFERQP